MQIQAAILVTWHIHLTTTKANLEEAIKHRSEAASQTSQSQTTYSHVYLRIQPYYTLHQTLTMSGGEPEEEGHLQFLFCLCDPANHLTHISVSQTVPDRWLDLWDDYDWVEDMVADVLRNGVEVLGQEYLVARMGWGIAPSQETESEANDNDTQSGEA